MPRGHAGDPAVLGMDRRDFRVFEYLRAAGPGALGQGHGGVGRVDLAVVGEIDRADQVVDIEDGVEFLGFAGTEQGDFDTAGLAQIGAPAMLLPTRLIGGDADAAVLLEADGLAGLGLEPLEQLHGVFGEPRQGEGAQHLAHQAGGMPGGAAGQGSALEQNHIGPAQLGQMIGDAAAGDTAADDDHAGLSG